MCSTTRAALLTGRNHHSVGVGCLANFDSGYPGLPGQDCARGGHARRDAASARLPHRRWRQVARHAAHRFRAHRALRRLAAGPRLRSLLRVHGCRDGPVLAGARPRQHHIDAPGTYESGYHLTTDLVDKSIRYLADLQADAPETPWLLWVAFGACHAPHQAPAELIREYHEVFATRMGRRARTAGAPAGDGARAIRYPAAAAQRRCARMGRPCRPTSSAVHARLQAAYAAMLDHADQQIGRLLRHLDAEGSATTPGARAVRQRREPGGRAAGHGQRMGPYNFLARHWPTRSDASTTSAGPDTHTNFPHGWAMASNTPLRRYKQNTHGGGIRDPLVMSWPPASLRGANCGTAFAMPPIWRRRCSRSSACRLRR
jgi:arylsulfatase A-like enzyme